MSVRSAQSVTIAFTVRAFATGVQSDADSLPAGALYVNGVLNGATVTITHLATGKYTAQVTLPTLALNDMASIMITATVSSITDNAIVWRDTKDFFAGSIPDHAAGAVSGLPLVNSSGAATDVNVVQWAGDSAGIGVDASHYPKVDVEDFLGTAPNPLATPATIAAAVLPVILSDSTAFSGATIASLTARIPSALSANGNMKSDIEEIAGNTGGAARLDRSARAIGIATVGVGSSTSSIVTSSLSPAASGANQFFQRIIIFDKDTTTVALRGQGTNIISNTSGGVFTVTPLTAAPVSGDTFTIT